MKGKSKKARMHAQHQRQSRSAVEGVKQDMRGAGDQAAWGTSSASMGRVKAESEEARLESCPSCGYSGGRHARSCDRGTV